MITYAALFEPDLEAGGFVVTIPDISGAVTQGDTFEEAMDMAQDAIAMLLNHFIKEGKDIPAAKSHRGKKYHQVSLSSLQSLKVELYIALQKSGLRKAELARRLHIPRANVNRLFDLYHASSIGQIEEALKVLGRRLVVSTVAA